MDSSKFMTRAIELAIKGEGDVNPNPLVGCVIVKDNNIISEAYHMKYGEYHAERLAINNCDKDLDGAELYVTLEPCCHFGKTPPCTQIIIESKIKKVFIGTLDPNPLVRGKGVKILEDNGIEVVVGVEEERCKGINKVFNKFIMENKPYVTMKYAMSIDGKIATDTGDSRWISNSESRQLVMSMRNRYSAIMVGINTVLNDNPMLNCRLENGINPIRIVCDSNLKIPLESKIVNTANEIKTIIATCSNSDKAEKLRAKGCEIMQIKKNQKGLDLNELMAELGKNNIDSILLEGGGAMNFSALSAKIVDDIYCFIGPKIIGGSGFFNPIKGQGVDYIKDAYSIENISYKQIDNDILIRGEVVY